MKEKTGIKTILGGIRAIGYCVDCTLLNSASVLAQHRERLYFVCIRSDLVEARKQGDHYPAPDGDSETAGGSGGETAHLRGADGFRFPFPVLPSLGKVVKDILEPEGSVPAALTLDEQRWAKVSGSNCEFPPTLY